MSYLQFPRLAFSGFFQSDVSTVNNDPRHFDNDTFEPWFQELVDPDNPGPGVATKQWNGWWNPRGTGIMRFHECFVKSLDDKSGKRIAQRGDDPLVGCRIGNAPDRPSGKMVDLDTDWQNASNIYGLAVTIVAPDGSILMTADYESNPFRDLWFARAEGAVSDNTASASFQSVLTNVTWHGGGFKSRFIDELQAESERGFLSIRLTTYGFNGYAKNRDGTLSPTLGYGTVVGNIGPANPHKKRQPHSFILGRRFMPATTNPYGDLANGLGIGCFSAFVDESDGYLHVDLSNAMPTDANFVIRQQQGLRYAVLHDESIRQDDSIDPSQYTGLGDVAQQLQTLQEEDGGVQSLKLTSDALRLMRDKPLALIQVIETIGASHHVVSLREAPAGLEVRAEETAFKLDPNDSQGNARTVTLYAARYGRPYADQPLACAVDAAFRDTSNSPPDETARTTPKAEPPMLNTPPGGVSISDVTRTDKDGIAYVTIQGPVSMSTPRGYIDGQLYTISYNLTGNTQAPEQHAAQQQFDKIAVVVYSTFPVAVAGSMIDIEHPRWEDVQPILQQYANLYPVMSQGMFDFSKQEVADSAAFIMKFVFDKPDDDPDQMPVTRDLSSTKRRMLINYFSNVIRQTGKTLDSQVMFGKRCPMHRFAGPDGASSPTDVALTYGKKR
jgi:hypothetical protein